MLILTLLHLTTNSRKPFNFSLSTNSVLLFTSPLTQLDKLVLRVDQKQRCKKFYFDGLLYSDLLMFANLRVDDHSRTSPTYVLRSIAISALIALNSSMWARLIDRSIEILKKKNVIRFLLRSLRRIFWELFGYVTHCNT